MSAQKNLFFKNTIKSSGIGRLNQNQLPHRAIDFCNFIFPRYRDGTFPNAECLHQLPHPPLQCVPMYTQGACHMFPEATTMAGNKSAWHQLLQMKPESDTRKKMRNKKTSNLANKDTLQRGVGKLGSKKKGHRRGKPFCQHKWNAPTISSLATAPPLEKYKMNEKRKAQ